MSTTTTSSRVGPISALMRTSSSAVPLVLRLSLAVVMWPHGAQKLLGLFGGSGWSGTLQTFDQYFGLPTVVAILVILLEFFGPVLLAVGFLTRLVALCFFGEMLGAIVTVHWNNGFFMNWTAAANAQEGFEYHLLVLGITFALVIAGSGALSLDRKLST